MQVPDLWQQHALRALNAGNDVIVDAPTGAGKTWIFELFVKSRKGAQGQAVYTVPTRALANDKWREWRQKGWRVGIATGDLAEDLDAPVLVATLETQRERILSGEGPALLAIDEYQMIADPARGLNYELAVAHSSYDTQLLLMSGSVENPGEVAEWLTRLGREVELVQTFDRPVPLEEMPVEELPRLPEKTGAFWPRVAAGVCLQDMAPLLLFAPRREAAENLARKIANTLPADDPIELPTAIAQRAGKPLCKLLRSRVAYHHSGLDYETRAGVIEPLAKAGQLRVIVATTGLAAGINFSVRSVAITETTYREGAFLKELRPDEILQMIGRAGRRGLDDIGYVITARHTPRPIDAAPLRLRRVNEIDWPTLLRVMSLAAQEQRDPFGAAADTCEWLFSTQKLRLGIEPDAKAGSEAAGQSGDSPFDGPRQNQFCNHAGEWQAMPEEPATRPLGECLVEGDDGWQPALADEGFVQTLGRGRLCKIDDTLGLEVKVARFAKACEEGGERSLVTLKWVREAAGLDDGSKNFTRAEFEALVIPELDGQFEVGTFHRLVRRSGMLAAQLDLRQHPQPCLVDEGGHALIAPPERTIALEVDTHYEAAGRAIDPPAGSAAYVWRKLGLVDEQGSPTRRGEVVSLFQGGEGLVVAAGLEDETYAVDELVWHLANLRGGYRFTDTEGGDSSRLGAVTRSTYGMVDHPGYLQLGLPPGYGDGAAEVLASLLLEKNSSRADLSIGDVERAKVEWLSLLRHIMLAPGPDWERWRQLSAAAAELVKRYAVETMPQFEPLDAITSGHRPRPLRRHDFPR